MKEISEEVRNIRAGEKSTLSLRDTGNCDDDEPYVFRGDVVQGDERTRYGLRIEMYDIEEFPDIYGQETKE